MTSILFKGPLTCQCLMTYVDVYESQNHYLLDSNVYHIVIIILSCIFLRSAKPHLLKSTRSSFASCNVTEGKNKHNNRQWYAPCQACLEWRGCGSGMGTGWGQGRTHPFEISPPPPPPVVSKGCVESGEFNKRTPSRQRGGGGGGLSRKGVLSSLLYQPF